MKKTLINGLLLISLICLYGCSTMQSVEIPQDPHALIGSVKIGDRVRVITTDKNRQSFVVAGVDSRAIYGDDQKIPYTTIAYLEKKQLDIKAILFGLGGLVAGIVIGEAIVYATSIVL